MTVRLWATTFALTTDIMHLLISGGGQQACDSKAVFMLNH